MKEFFKAVNKLAQNCVVKALKVNLNTGDYKILYLTKGENISPSVLFDDWVNESIDKELIHPDYAEAFKHIINVDYFKKAFKYKKYIHYKFKRMPYSNGTYKTNVITVLPASKDEVYVIVYDIEER